MNISFLRRIVGRGRRTIQDLVPTVASIDFRSGLGDSAYLLYGLARALKPQVAVEIGSARGKSACFVGTALKENGGGKLFAIDPHIATAWNDEDSVETLATMRGNIRSLRLENHVEIVRDTSDNVAAGWKLPIDMLFIDGDHSYDGVKRDWENFSPFVTTFGAVIFHDTLWDLRSDSRHTRKDMGVPVFADELRANGYPVITMDRDFGLSIVQPTLRGIPLVPGVGPLAPQEVSARA